MPIHEYRCRDCGQLSELLIGVGRNSDELRCKKCGGLHLEVLMSAAAHSVKFHLPRSAPGSSWSGQSTARAACTGTDCKQKA